MDAVTRPIQERRRKGMIETKVTGMCKGCPFIDPTFSKLGFDTGESALLVYCSHQKICQRIEKLLKQEGENKEGVK